MHILDENGLVPQKRPALIKVYIFNSTLAGDSDMESRVSIRGYFVCRWNDHNCKGRLRDALGNLGLQLNEIEREEGISEQLLFESLPDIYAIYRLHGYGLELYSSKSKPVENKRLTQSVALSA